MKASVWELFFDHHAHQYDEEVFTKDTDREVEFLVQDIGLAAVPPGEDRRAPRILDMGCGTGRHTVALAQRGFAVSGVDISKGMLNVAADRAARAGVEVELIQRDARSFNGAERFDIVLSLCEGSMGLMEVDEDPHEHDAAVMAALYRSLRPGGVAVLNALNGLKLIRQYSDEDVAAGVFDPYQITETHPMEFELEGRTESVMVKEKAYLPFEFAELVREAGFTVDHIWGGTAGRWARRPLELDEYEMMVLAHR